MNENKKIKLLSVFVCACVRSNAFLDLFVFLKLLKPYLGVCDEQTVGVLVFTGNLIVRQHVGQLLDKSDHFLVPGDISHGQAAGGALPAVRHSLRTARHTQNESSGGGKGIL